MMPISTEPQIFIMDRVSSERKRSRKKEKIFVRISPTLLRNFAFFRENEFFR